MLRKIWQTLLGVGATKRRRRVGRAVPARQLKFENLECRELLSVNSNLYNAISNSSFETPVLASQTFEYAPAGSSWQFGGTAGISSNGSGFTAAIAAAPDGSQVAFLQGTAASISQTVTLATGTYDLSLEAAQRAGQPHYQQIELLVDGVAIGTITPNSTSYSQYETPNFAVTAGTHSVELLGLNPLSGDNTALVDEVAVTAATSISDGSFEAPGLAATAFQYAPDGSPWQFSTSAGISSNGSDFTSGNPAAPDGSQVAFLQANSSISQSLYLSGGTYSLSLDAAQRAGQKYSQEIEVLLDGNEIGTITPTSTSYSSYQTPNFTVAAGTHTVEFLGLNPQGGDNTAFLDLAAITTANLIGDGSFESPQLAAGVFEYAPTGTSWQFSATAGVSSNGSAFTTGNSNAPAGSQVAVLEETGSISQSVTLQDGTYNLSFQAAQRAVQTGNQQIEVLVDNTEVGTATPAGTTYGTYQMSFVAVAGTYNLEFLGLDPQGGDNTALIDEVTLTATNVVSDGSFESPVLSAQSFQYTPGGSAWQFGAGTGISSNGSGFTDGNAGAPDGSQVAFIQATGSISQSVCLGAGSYTLSLEAAQRAGQTYYQEIEVLVDGTQVGTVTPAGTSYAMYQMSFAVASAGTHTLELLGTNPLGGDNTALVDEVSLTAANLISDGSFEAPELAAYSYQYAPDGSSWQFSSAAGVSSNGSGFTADNPSAPDGSQVAFIQGTGSMSQPLYLNGGSYTLALDAAQRAGEAQYQEIEVLVDGTQIGTVTPGSSNYNAYQLSFTASAGMHTLEFLGMDPLAGDSTAFLDSVSVAAATTVSDGSFEAPELAVNAFQYAPVGSAWHYGGPAGVSANGSAFTTNNSKAPDGSQVAFIQGTGSISQSVYMAAGSYTLSVDAAQRSGQKYAQEIEVLVDGSAVGTITPTSSGYGAYETPAFTVAAGTHNVEFLGLNPQGGDNTAFLDLVSIADATSISDGSFETPSLPSQSYEYLPNGTAWQFGKGTGIAANGSGFTSNNPKAPDGTQVAFIQGSAATMSQSVSLSAGTYSISLDAAQRSGEPHYQAIEVFVDTGEVGTIIPTSTGYGSYQTPNFTVTAGLHTIRFLGTNPLGGDNTAFIDLVTLVPEVNSISDGGFESPTMPGQSYEYNPAGSAWQFDGAAGVSSNGSAFTSGNPNTPDGSQVAFLQGGSSSSISQSVYLDAGTYTLSFLAAQRAGQSSYQEFDVCVDGAEVGTITPSSTSYGSYASSSFTVAAGLHTISFVAVDPQGGDNTAFIDGVQL
jgi:hypothetical protein